jgi:hypothetical protein
MEELPVGTILTPRDNYEANWSNTDFYTILEYYRPVGMASHKTSVFMVADEDDIDLAGGGTDWFFIVQPMGKIEKHDLNWSSEISMLSSDGYKKDSDEIKQAAMHYWNGTAHYNESVWEFLAPKAKILHVEEY